MYKKIINPCVVQVDGKLNKKNAYAEIAYDEKKGRLSITGVVGPTSNGGCYTGGQCVDVIRDGVPTDEWTVGMLIKFCDIWDKYHLNDMRPYCAHQKALGWDKLASREVKIHKYVLTREAIIRQDKVKNDALSALKKGETFTPTERQTFYAALPYSVEDSSDKSEFKEVNGEKIYKYKETKAEKLGFLYPDRHPDGLLAKPCPVCGYKYGTGWHAEPVPEDVLEFLYQLPASTRTPAWI